MHLARQQILLRELKNKFDVDVQEYKSNASDINSCAVDMASYFSSIISSGKYDLALIRGDRFEMLPIAMMCAYKGIPIAHIEGGDISGAIDNKVRHAITSLSDIHFSTNKESYRRLITMGTDPDLTFNFGSLDVEYADAIMPYVEVSMPYVVMCHHAMPGEDPEMIERVIREEHNGEVIVIKSNSDNGKPYGTEEFSNEDYIKLISQAKCLVGNSSSFLKEASIFGTPVLIIGSRQSNRLMPENVKTSECDEYHIRKMLRIQLESERKPSKIYYKPATSLNIVNEISKFLKV